MYSRIVFFIFVSSFLSVELLADPVTVYILDNGVRMDHEAFKDLPGESVDFVSSIEKPAGSDERSTGNDNTSTDPSRKDGTAQFQVRPDDAQVKRVSQDIAFGDHATLVAGLAVKHVPEVTLVSIRTLNAKEKGKWSDFLKGVHWITNHHPAGQAAVANLSLGGVPEDPRIGKLVTHAIDQLVNDGVTVVVAAGNEGEDVSDRIPSVLESVISVGAVSLFNFRLRDSNYGSCVDVYAPGENVRGPGGKHSKARIKKSGTSVAAAVVTGRVAAHLAKNPEKSPSQMKEWLLAQSVPGKVGNIPKAKGEKTIGENWLFR